MQKQFFMRGALFGFCFAFAAAVPSVSSAANTPCSGKKGGVAHCDGARFVCNDGAYSASKKVCSAGMDGGGSGTGSKARSGRSTGGQVKPAKSLPSPFN